MGFRQILNVTLDQAQAGISFGSMPELDPDNAIGVGPQAFDYFVLARNLVPLNPSYDLTIYPGPVSITGSDSDGHLGILASFSNSGDDVTYFIVAGGIAILDGGFYKTLSVSFLNAPHNVGILIDITVSYTPTDISGYAPNLVESPSNFAITTSSFDPVTDIGTVSLSFDFNNSQPDNPDGFAINRNGSPIASVPFSSGTTNYTFDDTVFNADGMYTYSASTYKYGSASVSAPSSTASVDFSGGDLPDIDITGSGGFAISGSAAISLLADPSGLYTLVRNKANDTIYDRDHDSTFFVKIPDPFAKTGFIGG